MSWPADWSQSAWQWLGFVGTIVAVGCVGFWLLIEVVESEDFVIAASEASRRAALIGAFASLARFSALLVDANGVARQQQIALSTLMVQQSSTLGLRALLLLIAPIAFLLSSVSRGSSGSRLAAALSTVAPGIIDIGTSLARGRWRGALHPTHLIAAGLWIGTLFVIVAAVPILASVRESGSTQVRSRFVRSLIHAFSPMALACAAVLAISGLLSAMPRLGHVDALWTSAYGVVLCAKLTLLALLFALGAWNWRRVKPALDTPVGLETLGRSSAAELVVALGVTLVSAVLVTLPVGK